MIVNYDCTAFIVQATDANKKWCHSIQIQIGLLKLSPGANVIKNTMVNYCGSFSPTFSRVKMTLKNVFKK